VDYVQIIEPDKKCVNREREISYIIQELARLKQEYQVCIMAISSFNRSERHNIPTLSSLKDSGSLEYAIDYGLLLYWKYKALPVDGKEKMDGKPEVNYIYSYMAKNRLYGLEDKCTLEFDKKSLKMKEVEQ